MKKRFWIRIAAKTVLSQVLPKTLTTIHSQLDFHGTLCMLFYTSYPIITPNEPTVNQTSIIKLIDVRQGATPLVALVLSGKLTRIRVYNVMSRRETTV